MKTKKFEQMSSEELKMVEGSKLENHASASKKPTRLYQCDFNGAWDGPYVDEEGKRKAEAAGGKCDRYIDVML